jgi:hypothetical protein
MDQIRELGIAETCCWVHGWIHEMEPYTTFARPGGGLDTLPTDRGVDGIDQMPRFRNGDEHGRRDWLFISSGDELGATVNGRYKQHEMWKQEYPHRPWACEVAFAGIDSASPETRAIGTNLAELAHRIERHGVSHDGRRGVHRSGCGGPPCLTRRPHSFIPTGWTRAGGGIGGTHAGYGRVRCAARSGGPS